MAQATDLSVDTLSNAAGKFSWIPIYHEIAQRLLEWEDRQEELIAFLEQLRSQGLVITKLTDQDSQGTRSLLQEIDPFTFFGVFNRRIRIDQRLAILAGIIQFFGLSSQLPRDFDGLPTLNNQNSWFFAYQIERKPHDVQRLWRVFRLALGDNPLEQSDFLQAFDEALEVKHTNLNLTMGLFWIRPETFLNLDLTNRQYLKLKLPASGLSAEFYSDTINSVLATEKSLPELSLQAWNAGKIQPGPQPPEAHIHSENSFWLMGAFWSGNDPPDQTQRFLDEGIWENGYEDRYLDEVRSMRVDDKIAIKASSTQRHNLPFDTRGKTVSRMTIKAIGTVVANRGDGRIVEVEWEPSFQPKDWYFYTYRNTVWQLRSEDKYAKRLIEFVFDNKPQDYDWFCQEWWGTGKGEQALPPETRKISQFQPYSADDMVASGVFLTDSEVKQTLDRLQSKKNLILQGPPGVGKTFIARKLAYALMEEMDDQRIEMVQFHQSYSYEDFIRGYRPLPDKAGTFGLHDGIFFDFCLRAKDDPDRPYVFIIDEINRGNLSQIFGELLMLIEADKRGPENVLSLVYHKKDEPRFYVPKNIYLIGLMNVADRSLAMVDYALRRRFAFMTLRPQFKSDLFRKWLVDRGMNDELVGLIVNRMVALNREITDDNLLGENYQIGHSFFCPKGNNFEGLGRNWYEAIVQTEILPLLREYWFDNSKRIEQIEGKLLAP
jgi:5-methylcytosine-specific restriction protein B